jgi:hypothetical protein
MKLSAIIMSVNIAATLPIAMQSAAQASEEANSPTAKWLKSNLKTLDARPKPSITAARRKFSIDTSAKLNSQSVVCDSNNQLIVNGVRLRPFMPGRKLPHRSDLQTNFLEQQAKLAQEPSPLSGVVSEDCAVPGVDITSGVTKYKFNNPYVTKAPRVVPNEKQVIARKSSQGLKRKREPIQDQQPVEQNSQESNQGIDTPSQWMANEQNFKSLTPPSSSFQDRALIQNALQNIDPKVFDDQVTAQSMGSAGPPPFPLNLLPQQSLKQFVSGGRTQARKLSAPPSFFGAWHGDNLIARNFASTSGLPEAGFQSNLRVKSFAHSHASPTKTHTLTNKPSRQNTIIAQARKVQQPELKISLYPPYSVAY